MEKRANQQSEDSPTEEKREQELLQESNQDQAEQVSANDEKEKITNEEAQPTKAADMDLNTEGSEIVNETTNDNENKELLNSPGLLFLILLLIF